MIHFHLASIQWFSRGWSSCGGTAPLIIAAGQLPRNWCAGPCNLGCSNGLSLHNSARSRQQDLGCPWCNWTVPATGRHGWEGTAMPGVENCPLPWDDTHIARQQGRNPVMNARTLVCSAILCLLTCARRLRPLPPSSPAANDGNGKSKPSRRRIGSPHRPRAQSCSSVPPPSGCGRRLPRISRNTTSSTGASAAARSLTAPTMPTESSSRTSHD